MSKKVTISALSRLQRCPREAARVARGGGAYELQRKKLHSSRISMVTVLLLLQAVPFTINSTKSISLVPFCCRRT